MLEYTKIQGTALLSSRVALGTWAIGGWHKSTSSRHAELFLSSPCRIAALQIANGIK